MSDWARLESELDVWAGLGRPATFWWRDDDAVEPTAELDRLHDLARPPNLPIALAVIPARVASALGQHLAGLSNVAVLQHGYAHRNHAPATAKKSELADARPIQEMCDELLRGQSAMAARFGAQALPVLVPPWNRIAPELIQRLPELGFRGLSTHLARPVRLAAPGLIQVNCHVDLMRWKEPRGFLGAAQSIDLMVAHLAARRHGRSDPDEPTGILTHHRVHDEPLWEFLEDLLALLDAHPAAHFMAAGTCFAQDTESRHADLSLSA